MAYNITYEDLDKHWIVTRDSQSQLMDKTFRHKIVMRFPSRSQAELFVEGRINYTWDGENNSEKEG